MQHKCYKLENSVIRKCLNLEREHLLPKLVFIHSKTCLFLFTASPSEKLGITSSSFFMKSLFVQNEMLRISHI